MTLAPLVVAVRATLALTDTAEPGFYWIFFALGGTLSGLGMILAATSRYGYLAFPFVVAGAATALIGHNVVPRLPLDAIALTGPSLVHLGTALVLWPWARPALAAGILAALGAYLRWDHPATGNVLLLLGALGLFAALLCTAYRSPPATDT